MQVQVDTPTNKTFSPIKLTITIESLAELAQLAARFNLVANAVYDDLTENKIHYPEGLKLPHESYTWDLLDDLYKLRKG